MKRPDARQRRCARERGTEQFSWHQERLFCVAFLPGLGHIRRQTFSLHVFPVGAGVLQTEANPMQKSTKAVLLSAFVFPGAGHLLLKKYRSAALLVSVSFAGLYYLISNAVEKGVQIAEAIQSGDVAPDIAAITDLVSRPATGSEAQLINLATVAVFICWIFGIVDAYRVGRARDRQLSSQRSPR